MSEEILRALMELFAIIIKQDGGLSEQEKEYVRRFLLQQIGDESGEEYFRLFLETATDDKSSKEEGKKLTSVLDSVRILKIGKKISNTLNQQQKVVVLVRSFELINTEYKLTGQRLGILETLADIFRISKEEYQGIFNFVSAQDGSETTDPNILVISGSREKQDRHRMYVPGLDRDIFILRIPSVDLYFLRYTGEQEIQLNGHNINREVIYLVANGSSIRLPVGHPLYYSDIAAKFLEGKAEAAISMEVDHLEYLFPGNVKGLQNITFSVTQGNLVGILGASGSGKTTLLNVLSGIYKPS